MVTNQLECGVDSPLGYEVIGRRDQAMKGALGPRPAVSSPWSTPWRSGRALRVPGARATSIGPPLPPPNPTQCPPQSCSRGPRFLAGIGSPRPLPKKVNPPHFPTVHRVPHASPHLPSLSHSPVECSLTFWPSLCGHRRQCPRCMSAQHHCAPPHAL